MTAGNGMVGKLACEFPEGGQEGAAGAPGTCGGTVEFCGELVLSDDRFCLTRLAFDFLLRPRQPGPRAPWRGPF